ncbi:minor tail protein [Microbacterium phage Pajaza]|uniref:Minor tail protein n=1 Tax=Microbacterium phage Pajaza TaxID=2099443 RepID=A0A2P1CIL5_9CAUD|nr:minor tail protein [Microbacterium phage Pajaza]
MAEYSRVTSRGDWTGEWDPSAVTQALLRMDTFAGSGDPRDTPDSSGRGRTAYVVNYEGTDARPRATRWGTGLQMNYNTIADETYIRVENDGSLFPSSGSMMAGVWVKFEDQQRQWNPIISTRGTPGQNPLFHLVVNYSASGYLVNYRFYNESGGELVNDYLTTYELDPDTWYWIGCQMDLTLGTYSVFVVNLDGTYGSTSGVASGLNPNCRAHLDFGFQTGYWTPGTFDEAILVAPFTGNAGEWMRRSALADGALEETAADTTTVDGRIAPRSTATLPVVAHTRAVHGQWGTDTPQITLNGQGATVRYRTSNNLSSWSAWKNASQIATEPNAAWIQYEVTLTDEDSYLDDILLSTAPPPTPPLPKELPVEPFSLDPLLIVPSGGGVLLQDTLLECKTLDTSSNESTLTFVLSLADPKATRIEPEMPVYFKGRHYVARSITTTRQGLEHHVEVYCERLWYNLLFAGQIDAQTWTTNAFDAISSVLAGTDWYVGQVDPTQVLGWENDSATVLGVLKQIASVYGGDLVFDDKNKFVHLLDQGGRDRGTYFTYEKGVKSATKREDTTNLVTRLYGRNEEGLTIAPANNGVPYIEDFTWTNEVRESTYDFKSGMTPQAMMRFLTAFLADRAKPTLSYEYTVGGLGDRVDEIDRFEVLDVVFIMDEDYSQSVKNRIVQLEIDWVDLRKSKITLANKLRSLASSEDSTDPGALTTGQQIDTRDINPFNLLLNSRADNGMAHWAGDNVSVVEGGATGRYSFAFGASGGSLEQTVSADNRSNFVFSAEVDAPQEAKMTIEVTFQYTDGTTETQTLEL